MITISKSDYIDQVVIFVVDKFLTTWEMDSNIQDFRERYDILDSISAILHIDIRNSLAKTFNDLIDEIHEVFDKEYVEIDSNHSLYDVLKQFKI